MSVASEITRLQNAKASLKTSINAKTDQQHQITNETIDDYSDFIDSITTGGGGLDWTALGYSGTPAFIQNGYNYAKNIYDNWENVSELASKFKNDTNLIFFPLVNTSNAVNMNQVFNGCTNLIYIPVLDTSKMEYCNSLFANCTAFNNETLDNILQMCINASSYKGQKKLSYFGFGMSTYPSGRIQALPHYQDFITAGWTIGY